MTGVFLILQKTKKGAFTYGRAFQAVQDSFGKEIFEDEPKSVRSLFRNHPAPMGDILSTKDKAGMAGTI